MPKVVGDEFYYAYVVDNPAIVIPETKDAICAFTELETETQESLRRMN